MVKNRFDEFFSVFVDGKVRLGSKKVARPTQHRKSSRITLKNQSSFDGSTLYAIQTAPYTQYNTYFGRLVADLINLTECKCPYRNLIIMFVQDIDIVARALALVFLAIPIRS